MTGTLVRGVGQADSIALCPPFRTRRSLSGSAPDWLARPLPPLLDPGTLLPRPELPQPHSCTVTPVPHPKGAL